MTRSEFIKNIYYLGYVMPKEMQTEAMNILVKYTPDEFIPDFFKYATYYSWENVVNVLEKIGCPRNILSVNALIGQLQDLNWPGTMNIIDLLIKMYQYDAEKIQQRLETYIETAYKYNDSQWLYGLSFLIKNKLSINKEIFIDKRLWNLLCDT